MGISIRWNRRAEIQFEKAIAYAEENSPTNAEKIKFEILSKINSLSKYPEINTPDRFKSNNDGTFRAFKIHRYRIAYRFKDDRVRILHMRHTKMSPFYY
jgi:plasmid stabilization system protein ParE